MSGTRRSMGEREFIALMAMLSASSAVAIDSMLPAFGAMKATFDLAPDSTRLSLTLTLFFLGTGFGFFIAGPLADAIGRRRVLFLSMTLYAVAALGSALAPSLGMLYLSRFVWGVAAAGPRTLAQAVLRDRFADQALARAMTLVMTFFYIAPVVAPVAGKGILELAGWRWIFGATAAIGAAIVLWGTRLPETLAPENRRPFSATSTLTGLRRAAANPITRSYALAVIFGFSAFFAFLGSIELVLSDVYDRANLFVPIFASFSAGMGVMAFVANRILRRLAAPTWTLGAGVVFLVASVTLLLVCTAGDGRPVFPLFLVLFGTATFGFAAVFPTANSIALNPMGALAGTATAGMGAAQAIVAAPFAAVIDQSIAGTVTPLAVGYTVFAALSLACQLRGRRHLAASAEHAHTLRNPA